MSETKIEDLNWRVPLHNPANVLVLAGQAWRRRRGMVTK